MISSISSMGCFGNLSQTKLSNIFIDIKCGIIMVKLVEKIKLPSVGPDGNPISYKFIHKVTGRQLLEAQTLGEAGIKDGDVLRLQPEITAGAM